MDTQVLIAGGGIGGLAAALALQQQGTQVRVLEQADAWGEVGAGIQLGPNVMRVLHHWGLEHAMRAVAAYPQRLEVRSAETGKQLGQLDLDGAFAQRYGAPYATIHRADMHGVLLRAAQAAGVPLQLQCRVPGWQPLPQGVQVRVCRVAHGQQEEEMLPVQAGLLIGADGLWSRVRQSLLPGEAEPRYSGILAYRAMVRQDDLPVPLRSQVVTAWLGPHMHMVQYPVRGGTHLNVVALVHGPRPAHLQDWDHSANAADLQKALRGTAAPVIGMAEAIAHWRLWPLCDRPPVSAATQMALGRVALLGDAAHPMRPFMAQGAGMAIEDAAVLAQAISAQGVSEAALRHYASQRWQRAARVQWRSIRNGEIFHSTGLVRLGRDMGMRLLGQKLLDVPWLYGGGVLQA